MAQTLMGALQAALRTITGSAGTYEGDWHSYLDTQGIPAGQFNGRLLQYAKLINPTISTFDAAHERFLTRGPSYAISAYGYNFAASGDYFSTPSAVANQVTGDLTLVVESALTAWTPAATEVLIAKDSVSAGGRSYSLSIQTSGFPRLNVSLDGSTIVSATANAKPPFTDGKRGHLGVERVAATGVVTFYYSYDMITWVQLGTPQSTTAGNIFAGNAVVQFGNLASLSYALNGKIYDSEIYAGLAISGTGVLKVDFDPSDWTSGTTWTSSDTGEVWTINGNALVFKAA